jgi:6-hydroxytryprostatin B O-methyltransferase
MKMHSMLEPRATDAEKPQVKVFLIRHVLHNLPDPVARSVLANVVSVLEPGARILIMDLVLPQPGSLDPYEEGMLRMRDLIQKEMANGRARDESDWNRLIGSVGQGVKILSLVRPTGSDLSLLEVGFEGSRQTKT